MRIASFDIFDTTLIRRCGSPAALFEQLAETLYPADTAMAEAFLLWRSQAGAKAAALHPGKEVTLTDIYATCDLDSFKGYSKEALMTAEKQVEANNLMANPSVKTLIQKKRDDGWQIVFISDMYLDSTFLREVLVREGCSHPDDPIYVSCEANCRKDTGELYKKIKAKHNPSPWEHYGDNQRSDIRQARRQGIKAMAIDTSFTPAEQDLLQAGNAFPQRSQWPQLVAISRTARISSGDTPFNSFAADFVAPAYLPYVLEVLRRAKEMGLKRLYFLSRDSYILMRMAEVFATDAHDLQLRYLFVSRRSLLLPYLAGGDEKDYLAAADHHTIVRQGTVDSRLAALGTNRTELQQSFGISFPYQRINNKAEEQDFLQKIFHSAYTPILQERAHQQYRLFVDYLKQEQLFEDGKSGMVDVGWLGTTRLMLNSILRKEGRADAHFFYFGIRGDVLPPAAGSYDSYYRCGELTTEATGLIENYFSASPYPTTIGYQKDDGQRICPIFPDGKDFEESAITKANVGISVKMAQAIKSLGMAHPCLLFAWSKQAINILTRTNVEVDLTPLLACAQFDTAPFVKRLGINELCQSLFLGKHTTAFDRASLKLSLPRICWNAAWKLHQMTGKFRVRLYNKFTRIR